MKRIRLDRNLTRLFSHFLNPAKISNYLPRDKPLKINRHRAGSERRHYRPSRLVFRQPPRIQLGPLNWCSMVRPPKASRSQNLGPNLYVRESLRADDGRFSGRSQSRNSLRFQNSRVPTGVAEVGLKSSMGHHQFSITNREIEVMNGPLRQARNWTPSHRAIPRCRWPPELS